MPARMVRSVVSLAVAAERGSDPEILLRQAQAALTPDLELQPVVAVRPGVPVDVLEALGARVVRLGWDREGPLLQAAINAAQGDVIIVAAPHGQHPMDVLPHLARMVSRQRYDLVTTNRLHGRGKRMVPLVERVGAQSVALAVRTLFGIPAHDVTNGLLAMSPALQKAVRWEMRDAELTELLIRSALGGFRWTELEITPPYQPAIPTPEIMRDVAVQLACAARYRLNLGFPGDQR